MTLLDVLVNTLSQDERLVSDGKLLKNKVMELGLKLDDNLILLLLGNADLRAHFFKDVNGTLIFNKDKFMKFVDNKEFLPDSYTSFKNRIGLTTNNRYLAESDEVVLAWPYKDCILEGSMEDPEEKGRSEIFWNEVLAPDEIDRLFDPKVLTNFRRINAKGEHTIDEIKLKDNLIIRGNNLLALHSLKKKFAGKVKLIYLDPPYNTGNDEFRYNDSFNESTWLTFIKNRLEVARELLRNDGVIFIQCDDNEAAYLKILMDEVFGAENYEVTLYVQVRYGQKTLSEKNYYQKLIEQIHVYRRKDFKPIREKEEYNLDKFEWSITELAKGREVKLGNRNAEVFFPGEYEIRKVKPHIDGLKETWASGTVLKSNASGKFFNDYISQRIKIDGYNVLYKVYGIGEDGLGYRYFTGPKQEGATKGKFYSGVPLRRREELDEGASFKLKSILNFHNLADNFGNCRQEGGVELRSGKKPEILLRKIFDISTKKGDIILDFFLGTGVTCAVAHKMNRQYIGIEQLNYDENDVVVRLRNVIGKSESRGKIIEKIENFDQTGISKEVDWKGGGDFVYCELMKWNEAYMDKIRRANTSKELIEIWDEMETHAFLSYRIDLKEFDKNAKDFRELSINDQKKFLIECLDKNQLYVNLSEINDEDYNVSDEDKKLNKMFYGVI